MLVLIGVIQYLNVYIIYPKNLLEKDIYYYQKKKFEVCKLSEVKFNLILSLNSSRFYLIKSAHRKLAIID